MANLASPKYSNIARPYALAAFECARDKNDLPAWKNFLDAASLVAQHPSVVRILENPEISSKELFELFDSILESQLNSERKNFLLLLAQNKRVMALAEIATLFNSYYTALEKISMVRVITAVEAEGSFRQKLTAALTNRIKHEVTLNCEVDPDLIAGAIIHIGDRVIDGSIRGKLTRLLEFSLR